MKKITLSTLALLVASNAFAENLIIRPYQSVRSSGMGGLKITTGLYDENVFGNPARRLANPRNRVSIFDLMLETNSSTISSAGDILGNLGSSDQLVQTAAKHAGENNHIRIQTSFPAFYKAAAQATETEPAGKLAWDLGLFSSSQFDIGLQRNFSADIGGIIDIGLSGGVARKFLENDVLGVGLNFHGTYRGAAAPNYGLIDMLKKNSKILTAAGGVDFDLGGTYEMPFQWEDFSFQAGASINNILGGKYSIAQTGTFGGNPPDQPRTLAFGMSARRQQLWIFNDALFGLEFQDWGNNSGASLWRTVHVGGEAHYGLGVLRMGFNEGYFTAGLGFLTRAFTLELATYGEELGLNMGDQQDRRYTLRLAFQI